eukprot:364743-Chlamydomonas_euryale.AAC.53
MASPRSLAPRVVAASAHTSAGYAHVRRSWARQGLVPRRAVAQASPATAPRCSKITVALRRGVGRDHARRPETQKRRLPPTPVSVGRRALLLAVPSVGAHHSSTLSAVPPRDARGHDTAHAIASELTPAGGRPRSTRRDSPVRQYGGRARPRHISTQRARQSRCRPAASAG